MDMQQAASNLQRGIGLPPSVATVLIWNSDSFQGLKVWIDAAYRGKLPDIPAAYGGYTVLVERRPEIFAL